MEVSVRNDDENNDDFSLLELRDRVVIMMSFKQLVTEAQIRNAWEKWKEDGEKKEESLWRILALEPDVDRENIFACAAEVYAFDEAVVKPDTPKFVKSLEDVFTTEQWQALGSMSLVPIWHDGKSRTWTLATFDPTNPNIKKRSKELNLKNYELRYAAESTIKEIIAASFPQNIKNEYLERVAEGFDGYDLGASYENTEVGLIDEDALEAEIGRSTLINLFEATLLEAVRRGVSDIHIFPGRNREVEIHFRVDGQLECWHRETRVHPESFLAVVKDNSMNVDRFERDAAQDGFIQRTIDNTLIRFRVSVLPIANASSEIRSESIVIRVLDDRNVITDLAKLGLLEQAMERFKWAISQPYGMVILTGPTGSGKTTTLFACLNQVVTPKVNVLTVEDPVEYIIPGVRQIKLNPKLSLEGAIRAILRHDPDIVMVGEMRDRATADLAIKLANTGHLTFSTLHTNDAPSAVSRLYKMGVEPFLLAYAINLVVAQRLIRKVCPACRVRDKSSEAALLRRIGFTEEEIENSVIYKAGYQKGCKVCNGIGYKGRRAITETLMFSSDIRTAIIESEDQIDEDQIRNLAMKEGMFTLRDSAREYIKQGETTVEELIRVVATEV